MLEPGRNVNVVFEGHFQIEPMERYAKLNMIVMMKLVIQMLESSILPLLRGLCLLPSAASSLSVAKIHIFTNISEPFQVSKELGKPCFKNPLQ